MAHLLKTRFTLLIALLGGAGIALSAPARGDEVNEVIEQLFAVPDAQPADAAGEPPPAPEEAPTATAAPATVEAPVPATAAAPLKVVDPARLGYAFDRPRVLAQQRLFGVAHATAQLAALCEAGVEDNDARQAAREAYAAWLERNSAPIHEAEAALARYYFAAQAPQASSEDIAAALRLPATLKVRDEILAPACATLPQALAGPRYNLVGNLERARTFTLAEASVTLASAVEICRPRLPETARQNLDEGYARWQTRHSQEAQAAQAGLAAAMASEAAAPQPTLPDKLVAKSDPLAAWRSEVQRRAGEYARQPAFCTQLASEMDGPRFDLSRLFADSPSAPTAP